jgi:hypothetical protein
MDRLAPGGYRVADMRSVCGKRGRKTMRDHTIRAYAIWLCHYMRYREGAKPQHIARALGVTAKTLSAYFDTDVSKPQFDLCRCLRRTSNGSYWLRSAGIARAS